MSHTTGNVAILSLSLSLSLSLVCACLCKHACPLWLDFELNYTYQKTVHLSPQIFPWRERKFVQLNAAKRGNKGFVNDCVFDREVDILLFLSLQPRQVFSFQLISHVPRICFQHKVLCLFFFLLFCAGAIGHSTTRAKIYWFFWDKEYGFHASRTYWDS